MVEPVKREAFLTSWERFRITLNQKHPTQVRQTLRKLGCDKIVVTRTGPHTWDFAGEFDAGRIVTPTSPCPAEPSLIETDARGYLIETDARDYLLKIAPTRLVSNGSKGTWCDMK